MDIKRALGILLLIVIPLAAFIIGASLMQKYSGRGDLPECRAADCKPLNRRHTGYDKAQAQAYWTALDKPGRRAERLFLWQDLAFPLIYGGALLCALMEARRRLHLGLPREWLTGPVIVGMIADWAENSVQICQLGLFEAARPELMSDTLIALAGFATIIKLWALYLAYAILVALVLWLLFRHDDPHGTERLAKT